MTNSTSEITFEEIGEDDPKKRKPNIEKAHKLLSWKPKIVLKDGLQKTIEYFETELQNQK